MSTVTVNWDLPTKRTNGVALAVSEIAFTRFELSFNGGPFTLLVDVPAPQASTTMSPVLAPGSYVLRSSVYDKQTPAAVSAFVLTPFVIPASVPAPLPAPNPVANQSVVVS